MPQDVKLVIVSGAGGGLVSWAFTIVTGATFGLDVWAALPLSIILGTAAALVAVYVVTPTDVTKTGRLIGYAVLCGFLWKPVLDAGRVVIGQRMEVARTSTELDAQVRQLRTSTDPGAVGQNAHDAATGAAQLLRSTEQLGNPGLKNDATVKAGEAVDAIATTSTANPVAAALALDEIRKAAAGADRPELARSAAQQIRIIEQSAPPHLQPLVAAPPP